LESATDRGARRFILFDILPSTEMEMVLSKTELIEKLKHELRILLHLI